MFNTDYRLPKVAVIGGGAAGAAAAAECQLIGFDVDLVDEKGELGGRYVGPSAPEPPKKFGFRKSNLRHTKVKERTAEAAREHIQAAVDYAKPTVRLRTRAQSAQFNPETSQWDVELLTEDGVETLSADVLIIATGTSTLDEIRDAHGRPFDVPNANMHQGMKPIGIPNLLVVDRPEPAMSGMFDRPLDVVEARAHHSQRYVRQLEINGPCAIEIERSFWTAAPTTRSAMIKDLKDYDQARHNYYDPAEKQSKRAGSADRKSDSQPQTT